jgi:hypothetical protein
MGGCGAGVGPGRTPYVPGFQELMYVRWAWSDGKVLAQDPTPKLGSRVQSDFEAVSRRPIGP